MKLIKRYSAIIPLVFLLFLLGSCQSTQKKQKQILRTNLMTSPPSLDPRLGTDTISENLMAMLFTGLTYIDNQGQTQLSLAKAVRISEDQKTYQFLLKDTKWSDGTALTAQDFIETWKEILNPSSPSESAPLFYLIKGAKDAKAGKVPFEKVGIRAEGSSNLIIELENPISYFLDMLTHRSFYPLHAKMRGKPLKDVQVNPSEFISNGPFFLKKYTLQKVISLKKNPHYWDAENVKLEGLEFSIIRDQSTALMLFEQGKLDWLGSPISDIALDGISELKRKGLLQVNPFAGVKMFMFNTQKYPLNNANIRKALSLAINRHSIVENITGLNDPPALGLVPPLQKKERWHAFYNDHDVQEAKKLFAKGLEELGINKTEFPALTISYNTSELWNRVVQAVQQEWQEVFGITVQLEHSDWKIHLDKLAKGNFQIGRYGWDCQFNDAGNILELFKYKDHANNYTRWENSKFVTLMDEATKAADFEKRKDYLEAAEKVFLEEMAAAPLFHYNCAAIQKPYVKGVYFSPLAMVDFRWAYLDGKKD